MSPFRTAIPGEVRVFDFDLRLTRNSESSRWRDLWTDGRLRGGFLTDSDAIEQILVTTDPAAASDIARRASDELGAVVAGTGVDPVVIVSPYDLQAAARTVTERHADGRVGAICLPLAHIRLSDRRFRPLYEVACSLRLPIVIHAAVAMGRAAGAARMPAGRPTSEVEFSVDLPMIAWASIPSLIFNGTFARHPNLRFVFSGFGLNWLESFMWRLHQVWQEGRSDAPWVVEPPGHYLERHFRFVSPLTREFPTPGLAAAAIQRSLQHLACFSHSTVEAPDAEIMNLLSPDTREAVLYRNAEALLQSDGATL